jgi:hypothetical protein
MTRTCQFVVFAAVLAASILWSVFLLASVRAGGQHTVIAASPPPTSEQIRLLFERTAENQHRNDRAVEEFERMEHVVTHGAGDSSIAVSDRTDRVLPSGTGTMKLQVAENGIPVSQDLYRRELQYAVGALSLAIHPNERYKQDLLKFERRQRDRAELVDTGIKAFRITWAGWETHSDPAGGREPRTLAKFTLEPDPNYKPTSRVAVTFEHVRAMVWIDESAAQFARLEGDITSDITFGGGIAGKIYHGGHFIMEQSEIVPGLWLPTLYTYDVDGRKFLFGFGLHERTEVSRYRHVGLPQQSIELIRNELNNLAAATPTQ